MQAFRFPTFERTGLVPMVSSAIAVIALSIGCTQVPVPGSPIIKIMPPPPPSTLVAQASCQVGRTECNGWVDDGSGNLSCPIANLESNSFTATTCFVTTVAPDQLAMDARAACSAWCNDSNLYPKSALGASVFCSSAAVAYAQALPGECATTNTPDDGATTFAQCTLEGRTCIESVDQSGNLFCGVMPKFSANPSGCFDPTVTTAQDFCRRQGAGGGPSQFQHWNVQGVVAESTSCPATSSNSTPIAYGIAAGAIGSMSSGGTTVPLVAKGGFMTAARTCDPTGEFCSTTLTDSSIALQDITFAGTTVRNPALQQVSPVTSGIGATTVAPTVQVAGDAPMVGHVSFVVSGAQTFSLSTTPSSASLTGTVATAINISPIGVAQLNATVSVAGSTSSPNAACAGQTSLQRLLGFETADGWTSTQAPLALTSALHTQGCFGLSVGGSGYRTINSSFFATPLAGTKPTLDIDVYIPSGQPNPSWLGAVQTYLSCPVANFNNQYIGQAELTGRPVAHFATLTYPIPPSILSMLTGTQGPCFFSVAVNMNSTPTAPVVDNIRFQ